MYLHQGKPSLNKCKKGLEHIALHWCSLNPGKKEAVKYTGTNYIGLGDVLVGITG